MKRETSEMAYDVRKGDKIVNWERTHVIGEWVVDMSMQYPALNIAHLPFPAFDYREYLEEEPMGKAVIEHLSFYLVEDLYPAMGIWVASDNVTKEILKENPRYFRTPR